jgi:hypothetical protein
MLEFLGRDIRACRKLLANHQIIYPDDEQLVPLAESVGPRSDARDA